MQKILVTYDTSYGGCEDAGIFEGQIELEVHKHFLYAPAPHLRAHVEKILTLTEELKGRVYINGSYHCREISEY